MAFRARTRVAGTEHLEGQRRESGHAASPGTRERARVADEPDVLFVRDGALWCELLAADDHQGDRRQGRADDRTAFRDSVWRGGDRDAAGRAQCGQTRRAALAHCHPGGGWRVGAGYIGHLVDRYPVGHVGSYLGHDGDSHYVAAVLEFAYGISCWNGRGCGDRDD